MERAKELLHEHRIEKLLVVDDHGTLRGLITIKDIEKSERFPNAAKDALGRLWQCSTVQFDFNLPERFDMTFVGVDNQPHRPYVVHRALLGSLERFFGMLIEHFAGAFPVWLAPVQVKVVTITDKQLDYAKGVRDRLLAAGIRAELDSRSEKMGFKIRGAALD